VPEVRKRGDGGREERSVARADANRRGGATNPGRDRSNLARDPRNSVSVTRKTAVLGDLAAVLEKGSAA